MSEIHHMCVDSGSQLSLQMQLFKLQSDLQHEHEIASKREYWSSRSVTIKANHCIISSAFSEVITTTQKDAKRLVGSHSIHCKCRK